MPRETRALSPNAVTQPLRRIPCSPQEPPFLEPPPFPISSSSVALRCFYLPPLLLPSISSAFSFSPLSSSLSLSLFLSVSFSLSDAHASQRIKLLSLGEKVVNSKIHCRLFGGMSSGGAGPAFGRVGSQASKDCGGLKKRKRRGRGFARSECSSR